jgi:L-ascorbate metabolism protein UlaG (beta-lactamase superfamily)
MKITWLGQAGLLLETSKTTVIIDPYLSNSVVKVNPNNWRRVPVDERFFDIKPDVMVFTHNHLDHYDPETAPRFFEKTEKAMTVLCPPSVWQKARVHGGSHNYVEFNRHTEWTEQGFRFSAVKAVHSDAYAIGVIIEDLTENKVYYVTGDTLYNKEIFSDLPEKIDVVFLPINGVGNNMNVTDAVRFFKDSGAKRAVPYHVGMFDSKTADIFDDENKIILEVYKESEL